MKIIVLGPEYSGYIAASYQYEFMNTLKEFSKSFYHYSETSEIDVPNLLKKANFIPDIIFYNHGWLSDNPSIKNITFSKVKGIWPSNKIKHIIFLNKEYTRLSEKLDEIRDNKYDLIFSHFHKFKSLNTTSIKSIFLPLACSDKNISPFREKKLENRKYDLFFSGILQNWNFKNAQGDLRKRIQNELFYCVFDFPILKRFKHKRLNIYWKPFYKNRIKNILSDFLHNKRLNQKDYFNALSDSKCVLHTSSPIGIISTRVFESLGSGSVGLFSKDSNAV